MGFGVWGLGFGVWGLGLGAWGLVNGLGYGYQKAVQGSELGYRVPYLKGLGFRI